MIYKFRLRSLQILQLFHILKLQVLQILPKKILALRLYVKMMMKEKSAKTNIMRLTAQNVKMKMKKVKKVGCIDRL